MRCWFEYALHVASRASARPLGLRRSYFKCHQRCLTQIVSPINAQIPARVKIVPRSGSNFLPRDYRLQLTPRYYFSFSALVYTVRYTGILRLRRSSWMHSKFIGVPIFPVTFSRHVCMFLLTTHFNMFEYFIYSCGVYFDVFPFKYSQIFHISHMEVAYNRWEWWHVRAGGGACAGRLPRAATGTPLPRDHCFWSKCTKALAKNIICSDATF